MSLPSACARPTLSTAGLLRVRVLRTCLREQLRALALIHFGQTADGRHDQSVAFLPRRGCSAAPEVTVVTVAAGTDARLEAADSEALDPEVRAAEASEAGGRYTTKITS